MSDIPNGYKLADLYELTSPERGGAMERMARTIGLHRNTLDDLLTRIQEYTSAHEAKPKDQRGELPYDRFYNALIKLRGYVVAAKDVGLAREMLGGLLDCEARSEADLKQGVNFSDALNDPDLINLIDFSNGDLIMNNPDVQRLIMSYVKIGRSLQLSHFQTENEILFAGMDVGKRAFVNNVKSPSLDIDLKTAEKLRIRDSRIGSLTVRASTDIVLVNVEAERVSIREGYREGQIRKLELELCEIGLLAVSREAALSAFNLSTPMSDKNMAKFLLHIFSQKDYQNRISEVVVGDGSLWD